MTRKEKCELAISRGYTYNPETGIIYNRFNKIVCNKRKDGYIRIESNIHLLSHQFAWYLVYKECVEQIDHINGIRDDNRILNLRSVTCQQNQWNRKTAKGYCFNKNTNKFRARIALNNKDIHLGCFNTEIEAQRAYLEAKQKYHVI